MTTQTDTDTDTAATTCGLAWCLAHGEALDDIAALGRSTADA